MENKASLQDGGGPSTSETPSEEFANILKEIQILTKEVLEKVDTRPAIEDEEGPSTASLEEYANRCREIKSFLVEMKQKMEGKRPPQDAESPSTSEAHSVAAAERLEGPQDGDCVTDRQYKELHEKIQEGDIESVERLVQDAKPGLPLCCDGISALKRSFSCKQVNISAFLIRFGVIFKDDGEGEDLDISVEDVDLINLRLWYFNRDVVESCIYKLMVQSKLAFQGDKNSNDALFRMYKDLFEYESIRSLMMVLEKEQLHIVYDFASKNIDRIYFEEATGLSGLTVPSTKSIYIGAEELLSESAEDRAKVKGVVAEEFCHLALQFLFENGSKPFRVREGDSDEVQTYLELISSLKSDAENEEDLPPIISDLFIGGVYESDEFLCELIARVPHLMGIHGEKNVRETFKLSPKLTPLLKFYDDNVIPACKSFTDPLYYSRPMMDLQSLHKEKGYILPNEKIYITFRDNENFFKEHLADNECIKVLHTNITKLCALRMYHELKERIVYHLDKVCLFFTLDTFEEIKDVLKQKHKSELIQSVILIVEDNIQTERIEKALDNFIGGGGNPIVIIILLSECENSEGIRYKWNDVPFEFKELFLEKSFHFKGKKFCFKDHLQMQDLTEVFENDIATFQKLTSSGELLRLDDGADLFSQHYSRDTYIERKFQAITVDKNILKDLQPHDTCIFLSGIKKEELGELPFHEEQVQWFEGSHDEIHSDKSIFIVNKDAEMSFEDLNTRCLKEKCIWLHYYEEELHVRNVDSCGDVLGHHIKRKTLSEEEMLNFLKRERTVIISDNAGYGKSTVISSLIDKVKSKNCRSWNWRINCNQLVGNRKDPLSIAQIEEQSRGEIMSHLFLILGMKNGLERLLFRKFSSSGQCFIYFDGFDEVPSEYKDSALKLLSTVRKQTAVNMIISTRKHHQKELEKRLNTFSHQLVPLSREDQVKYLDKMWKDKLKYPNSRMASQNDRKKVPERIRKIIEESDERRSNLDKELNELIIEFEKIDLGDLVEIRRKIDDLNFRKLAETVIEKTSLNKETLQFMGIPLHLFMIGEIYLHSNFNAKMKFDVHSIYSQFIEKKILIYVEEKQGMSHEGRAKKNTIKNERRNTYRIHTQLANQLMDVGRIESNMEEEDKELCSALGIVFINEKQIDFLHLTFAEFFKAESIRMNLTKKGFKDVLSDEKYKVVLRFLAGSLEKNNFETLTEEILKDVDFFVSVLKQFVVLCEKFLIWSRNYELDLHLYFIAKIVKHLVEIFEKTDDEDLLSDFLLKLDSELSSFRNWFVIGGCLSIKLLKMLINRNFKVHYEILLGVVKFYSNPKEVIDLLKECISIESAVESETNEGENENIERLTKILKFRDTDRSSLFDWGMSNMRIEVFLEILKFSKQILGKEKFINEITESYEYWMAIDSFIKEADFNRISGLLKALNYVFNKEMEMLINNYLKCTILWRTLRIGDESRNAFEEMINLFKKYFGIENLKQLFLSCDYGGTNLICCLIVYENRNLIENLNIIKSILDDKSKMKQFLMFKDVDSMNMFHFAARNRFIDFAVILRFGCENLEKHEIVEMLISCDGYNRNTLHFLFTWNSPEGIIERLNVIKKALADEELLKIVLKSKGEYLMNMLHFAVLDKDINFGEILEFGCENLAKHEIGEMLSSCVEYGDNVLHSLFRSNSSQQIIEGMNVIKNALDDEELFKNLLKSKNCYLGNMFHLSAGNLKINFGEILGFGCENLEKHEIVQMLISCNGNGDNVLRSLFAYNSSQQIIEGLNEIKNALADEELFKKLLKSKSRDLKNIFHFTTLKKDINFNKILRFGCENLEKHEIGEMLVSCDECGRSVLHLLFGNNSSEEIIERLNVIKNALADEESFKDLFKSKDRRSRNVFHFAAWNRNEIDISFLNSHLSDSEIRELMIQKDENGWTVLHLGAYFKSTNFLFLLNYSLQKLEIDKCEFVDLILAEDKDGETFLHFIVKNYSHRIIFNNESVVKKIIEILKENVSEDIFNKLLGIRNVKGKTFLQVKNCYGNEDSEKFIECCRRILEENLFEELLKENENNGEDVDDEEDADEYDKNIDNFCN